MRSEWDIVNRGALGQETISGNKYNKFSVLISKAWNFFPPQADIREGKKILSEFSKSNQELILGILYMKDERIFDIEVPDCTD